MFVVFSALESTSVYYVHNILIDTFDKNVYGTMLYVLPPLSLTIQFVNGL